MAETSIAEFAAWQQSNDELVEAGTPLGDLPLIVLRHGEPLPTEAEEAAWQATQAKHAALSTAGRLVVAEQSDHAIQLDQPELVVAAVRDLTQPNDRR